MRNPPRPVPDPARDWEHVVSEETWNGGDGLIRFNYLQQSEPDTSETDPHPETTDPWDISPG